MIPASTYADLLVICADAPSVEPPATGTPPPANRDRATAHRLLATEQCARLRATNRDWDHFSNRHPAFDAVALKAFRGGIQPAQFFSSHADGVYGISTPRVPDTSYSTTLAEVLAEAGPLIASVRAALGPAFDAQRFNLRGEAAPGAPFHLDPLLFQPTSTSIVLGSGTWRVQVSGHYPPVESAIGEAASIWSRATSNPETVSFGLALDGVVQVTHSRQREAPRNPTEQEQTVRATFFTTDDLVLASSKRDRIAELERRSSSSTRRR